MERCLKVFEKRLETTSKQKQDQTSPISYVMDIKRYDATENAHVHTKSCRAMRRHECIAMFTFLV